MDGGHALQGPKRVQEMCRTCMSSQPPLTSLFSILSLSSKEESLDSILFKCTSIQVSTSDTLPQSICNSCLENLAVSYLFRELCFESQIKLRQLNETESSSLPSSAPALDCPNLSENHPSALDDEMGPTKLEQQSCDFDYSGCDDRDSQDGCREANAQFPCGFCSKVCLTKYALNRHLKVHSDAVELKCRICLKTFTRATDVKRHLTTHTGEKPFKCTLCKGSFTQSGSLAAHIRQKHPLPKEKRPKDGKGQEKSHLCSACGKCFRHNSTLKMHLKRHLGKRPFECQTCNLRFVSSGRLKSHQRVHTGERPFICQICSKTFAHSSVLARHVKAHSDEKPHKCRYCPKKFLLPYYLNIHLRQHTGEKPLICPTCSKAFACPKTFRQHQKIHSDEKAFLCMNCGKSFRRAHHLKAHMTTHVKI